jgi:hypothetical protein
VVKLTAAYIQLRDVQLGQASSRLAFKAGLHDLTAAIAGNGRSLSENTKKGIANKQALVQLLQQAQQNAKGARSYGHTLLQNVDQFIKFATQAGFSRKAVMNLLGQMHMMPSQIKSRLDVNTATASQNLRTIQEQIAELPSYHSITVDVHTAGNLASTYASQVGGGQAYHPPAKKKAAGGWIGANEVFTVGEAGWEGGVSDSQGRVRIFSNAQSRAMGFAAPTGYAAGTGGGRRVLRATFDLGELGRMVREVVLDEMDYADSVGSLG